MSTTSSITQILNKIEGKIKKDLYREFGVVESDESLYEVLLDWYAETNEKFIFILDEWDCIFREYEKDKEAQKVYLDFLRTLFKDQVYVELVYMTGILPIKKYGTHSAINMFKEISILNPTPLENFTGFMESEVQELCKQFDVDYTKMKEWYDGYRLAKDKYSYNPLSVVYSLTDHKFENYWTQTETYEALKIYIDMNFDGLKEAIIQLLAGESVKVNPDKFQNDMTSLTSKDDVLTLMIHLGYLGYNREEESCYIPNAEVRSAFVNSVDTNNVFITECECPVRSNMENG